MNCKQNKEIESLGEKAGFFFSYIVFTTILYLVLFWLHKLPESWSFIHVVGITLIIVLLGMGISRLLQ